MDNPNCPNCMTDEHLDYLDVEPGHVERVVISSAVGIYRDRQVEPVVTYKCRACGHYDGHSVPMDWQLPGA